MIILAFLQNFNYGNINQKNNMKRKYLNIKRETIK